MSWTEMDYYYLSNKVWVYGNIVLILPFIISCVFRFRQRELTKVLATDHLARVFLIFTWIYYMFDMVIKYKVDGGDSICQKSFFIHHVASLFIMPPLFLNRYIPWWACPIGFMHGFCIYFPEFEPLNYAYASVLFIFHYGIYQRPYRDLPYYGFLRYFINFIWVFALMLLLGDCSNFLALGPD